MTRDRRRRAGPRHRRDHGRRAFGRQRRDHRRDARDRLFHARADRADRPGARPDQRRAQPLRARRRSGVPRRRAGDPHRADPRHLRRRGVRARSAPASRRSRRRTRQRSIRRATQSLGGIEVPEERQREILESLGFEFERRARSRVPTWRRDVDGPADLVEEVARIHGYDKVPSTPLDRAPGVAKPTATRSQMIERRVRRTAAARGLDEAVTWSFISEAEAEAFGGGDWRLANPISEEMKVMRPSLLPGLIAAARRNLDRGAASVRLFEIGRRYLADAEHPTVALLLAGEKRPRGWQAGKAQALRRVRCQGRSAGVARSGGRAGRQPAAVSRCRADLAPGRSATLRLGPKTIARRASASFIPGWQQAGRCARPARSRRKSISTRSRRPRSSEPSAAGIRAAGAAAGHPRFRVHRSGRACRRRAGPRDPRRRQGGDHRRPAVRPVRERRTACRWRSKSRSSRPTRASPTRRSATISKRIVAAAEKLGARLRS